MMEALQAIGVLTCIGLLIFTFVSCYVAWHCSNQMNEVNKRLDKLENKE